MNVVAGASFYNLAGEGSADIGSECEYFGLIYAVEIPIHVATPFYIISMCFMPSGNFHECEVGEVVSVNIDEAYSHCVV